MKYSIVISFRIGLTIACIAVWAQEGSASSQIIYSYQGNKTEAVANLFLVLKLSEGPAAENIRISEFNLSFRTPIQSFSIHRHIIQITKHDISVSFKPPEGSNRWYYRNRRPALLEIEIIKDPERFRTAGLLHGFFRRTIPTITLDLKTMRIHWKAISRNFWGSRSRKLTLTPCHHLLGELHP